MPDQDPGTSPPRPAGEADPRPPTWEHERERRAKADAYFNDHLRGQQDWYSKNASKTSG